MPGLQYGKRNCYKLQKVRRKIGVHYFDKVGKWMVQVKRNGVITTIGQFETEEEAKTCYKKNKHNHSGPIKK